MAEAQLRRNVRSNCRRAVALRSMVAAGDESHAHLPRQMRLRLRDFAGDEDLRPGEISEPQAHLARETGVSFIACGHHASERYGAPAVAAFVAGELGLSHTFIDIDNPA